MLPDCQAHFKLLQTIGEGIPLWLLKGERQMGLSLNGGTPNWSFLVGFPVKQGKRVSSKTGQTLMGR